MVSEDVKKRKACQACTKAKAKCSPFEDRLDICSRCQRLKKACVFDETVRKRGPKSRSRVKQLELRVTTLIDMLANGQTAAINASRGAPDIDAGPSLVTPPESAADVESYPLNAETGSNSPAKIQALPSICDEDYMAYDPVSAGHLDELTAESLVQDFKDSCISCFPFVVIPPSVNAKTLRQSQPFLFHAVLTVTAHHHPRLQVTLAEEMKEQVATRIIKHSHRSLELLQGLLLYTGWYHFYYNPVRQQIATMLALCVAMVQDLNLSKNSQAPKAVMTGETVRSSYSVQSLAEKRAFLGAFYLTVSFSQAWRKRATLIHTRYMDQCVGQLESCQEYASDAIIKPLVQLSALMCRINEYFSYDDILNAEVKGEAVVQLSVCNFESELARITESISPTLMIKCPTLQLSSQLLDMFIHECAVHGSLWKAPGIPSAGPMSAPRIKALSRCLDAVQSYLNSVISIPDASLYRLAFPAWSAWCYACILACKLVFLGDEREQQAELTETFTEVLRVVSDKSLFAEPKPCSLPVENASSTWNPVAIAREGGILSLFHQMHNKLKFALPDGLKPDEFDRSKFDPLCRIAYFQRNFLCSFTNRLNEHIAKVMVSNKDVEFSQLLNVDVPRENWAAPQMTYARQRQERSRMPLLQNLHFSSMNFDSIAPPEDCLPIDGTFADWLWNTVMDDFVMPPL